MQRVILVGGTHGNEWSGIYLCKNWEQSPVILSSQTFTVETYLANPAAVLKNRRYIDEDLNRQFCPHDLKDHDLDTYEAQRAKVIAQDLTGCDFLIDIHNTTSNMGFSLILSRQNALEDPLTRQICAHLINSEPLVKIYIHPNPDETNPYLPSLGKRDLTLEIGPQPHGTLRADLYFKMRALLQTCLQYLSDWQTGTAKEYKGELDVYQFIKNIDYPRDAKGHLKGMIHPRLLGKDYKPLQPGEPILISFDGQTEYFQGSETVWPVFINEQAYVEKQIAMSLTKKIKVTL